MPYIEQSCREDIQARLIIPTTPGELNFLFTDICKEYVELHGKNYQHYNDCIGALEACKLELYRRAVAPYEDEKIKQNGDVY